jgi:hypothetical protein
MRADGGERLLHLGKDVLPYRTRMVVLLGAASATFLLACGSGDTSEMPSYRPGGASRAAPTGATGNSSSSGGPVEDASAQSLGDGTTASFTLIDATVTTDPAGSPVPGFDPIPYGATIDLGIVGHALSIRANPPQVTQVGSVAFALDASYTHTTNLSPYSLCGDDGRGNFLPCVFTLQKHALTDTTYPQVDLAGTPYPPTLFEFTVVDSSADAGTDAETE